MEHTEVNRLLERVRVKYGYDFTEYSTASMKRRIAQFMIANKIAGMEQLQAELESNEELLEQFIQGISVTVTEMFRDPSFYRAMREKVIPRLATYPVIKVWLAGCATGEEIYSVAILLKEAGLYNRSVIYATDINQRSLKTAKQGIYPIAKMKDYTSNYIKAGGISDFSSYYKANFESVLMDKSLKKNIVFASHNLTADKRFNEFQLILCRNVLIYFNQELQNKVINLFYDSLCPFGFLALGNKESLLFSEKRSLFEDTDKREKIFMKAK